MKRYIYLAVFFALSILYGWLAYRSIPPGSTPVETGDYSCYSRISERSLLDVKFWVDTKPGTTSILHKLGGQHDPTIAKIQLWLTVCCHIALALTLFWALGGRILGLLSTLAIYLYALAPQVNAWSFVMLSEGPSNALQALFLAATVWLFWVPRWPTWRGIAVGIAFLLVFNLLIHCRYPWAYVTPVYVVALAVRQALIFRTKRHYRTIHIVPLALIVALCLSFWTQQYCMKRGTLWRLALTNVAFQRVLPDPEKRERWITEGGFPDSPEILRFAGGWGWDDNWFPKSYKPLQTWITEKGVKFYVLDSIRHPVETAALIQREWRLAMDDMAEFRHRGMGLATAPARFSDKLFHIGMGHTVLFLLPLSVSIFLFCWIWGDGKTRLLGKTLTLFTLTLLIYAATSILGDAGETPRHLLGTSIGLRLMFLLTPLVALRWFFDKYEIVEKYPLVVLMNGEYASAQTLDELFAMAEAKKGDAE